MLNAWLAGAFELIVSRPLLDELEEAIQLPRAQRRHGWNSQAARDFIGFLETEARLVVPTRVVTVCRDDDDNRILEAALQGDADYIVTIDNDLLVLGEFEGTTIVAPGRFLMILAEQQP
jgi:putative PIN family toxin of toxin-antitoxin system